MSRTRDSVFLCRFPLLDRTQPIQILGHPLDDLHALAGHARQESDRDVSTRRNQAAFIT